MYRQFSFQENFSTLSIYPLVTKIEIIKFISFVSAFFLILNIFEKKEQFKRAVLIIIFLGLVLSFYGLIKKYFILEKEITGSFSTFGSRNSFAGYMLMVASLAIGYTLTYQDKAKKLIFSFISAILCASIFLSLSRAGSLSLIFSLLL
ncbi:MAG: hypothetical protein QXZ20_03270, partial [Candidatus Aenigmatarchaeota archaeon]